MRSLAEDLIDGRANKADKNPTKPQIDACNYKLGKLKISGQQVYIENPAGSIRSGTDKAGQSWSCLMHHHYGYFPFTRGKDGDPVDVFVRKGLDDEWCGKVFVINQKNEKGSLDEHKVILGATTKEEARQMYRANYSPGWDGVLSIGEASFEDFRNWLRHGNKRKEFTDIGLNESVMLASMPDEPRKILREDGRLYIVEHGVRLWESKAGKPPFAKFVFEHLEKQPDEVKMVVRRNPSSVTGKAFFAECRRKYAKLGTAEN